MSINTQTQAGKARLFLPITKIDVATRTIYARITDETVDLAGEICDYDTSAPLFKKWSANAEKVSGGKSVGNLRAMHQPIAAGKLTGIDFDDAVKAIECAAKVVDDAEWAKCEEGVYTGLSLGGNYVGKKWKDAESGAWRYTVNPVEVSLVDLPCNPSATFKVAGADGIETEQSFKPWEPTTAEVAKAAEIIAKAAGAPDSWPERLVEARDALILKRAEDETAPVGDPAPVEGEAVADDPPAAEATEADKAAAPDWEIDQVFQVRADGSVHAKKADAKARIDALKAVETVGGPDLLASAIAKAQGTAAPTPATDADKLKPYGEVAYADPGLKADGVRRWPVDTAKNVRASWGYINLEKNREGYTAEQLTGVEKAVAEAWESLIDEDGPPSADKMALVGADLPGSVKAVLALSDAAHKQPDVSKGLYTITSVASLLRDMAWIAQDVCWEECGENDTDSALPQQAVDLVMAMRTFLVEMVTEEVGEMLDGLSRIGGGGVGIEVVIAAVDAGAVELAQTLTDCIKADTGLVQKIGARNSKGDAAKIQGIHDYAAALGAGCAADKAATADDVQKLTAERDALQAQVEKALPGIEALGVTVATLRTEIDTLKKAPAPMPEIVKGAKIESRSDDEPGGTLTDEQAVKAFEGLIAHLGQDGLTRLMVKAAQTKPFAVGAVS